MSFHANEFRLGNLVHVVSESSKGILIPTSVIKQIGEIGLFQGRQLFKT